MVIVPLVLGCLVVGVLNLGEGHLLKRIGSKMAVFYICTTLCAIFIGQMLISTFQPGTHIPEEIKIAQTESTDTQVESLKTKSSWVNQNFWPGVLHSVIPRNIISEFAKTNMLAIIFVSFLIGIALMKLPAGAQKESFISIFSILGDVSIKIVGWIMQIAPIAVAALMTVNVAKFGADALLPILYFVIIILSGLLIHFFIVYGFILKYIIKVSPLKIFRKALPIFITAFSTSSSAATMPVTIRTLEKNLGVPPDICNFSVPIGVTVNMDGTAFFEVCTVIFFAQMFGIDLSLSQHIALIMLMLTTSIGIVGIPGGSLPVIIAVMETFNIPVEAFALILGVDRILDMSRTTLNVAGDTVAALFLSNSENKLDKTLLS